MMDDTPFAPEEVDHLLLLIGTNPLPNALAACLLTGQQGHTYLLHTAGTEPQASAMGLWLGGHGRSSSLLPIESEADTVD